MFSSYHVHMSMTKLTVFDISGVPSVRCIVLILAIIGAGCAQVSRTTAPSLDDEFNLFLQWFPGEYDNHEQHWQDKLDQVEQVHEHLHHIFYRVDAPAIGENTFFVQQYMDGDPANVYRRRFYSFSLDPIEQAIRLDIYSFSDEDKYADAHLTPDVFADLTRAALVERPGCEVYWKFEVDYFHGYMKEKACSVISARSGKRIFITDDLRLTADEIWIRDEAFFEDGSRVFGNAAGIHHKNRKVQYYSGWAGVSSEGPAMALEDSNWTATNGEWGFSGDLDSFGRFVIHNEGQIVPIPAKDGSPTGFSVQLAKLTYQNTTVPILTLKILEDATGKTLVYSWTKTAADRIGINARWVQSGLTLQAGQPSYGFNTATDKESD